jgi:glucokinase
LDAKDDDIVNMNSRKDMLQDNRVKVLGILRNYGSSDIARLAEVAGLSKLTVGKIITHWRDRGVVMSCGKGNAIGEAAGKRPTLFKINHDYKYVFVAQILETTLLTAVTNLNAEVMADGKASFEKNTGIDSILRQARASFDAMSAALKLNDGRFSSIVLGTSGITNSKHGVIVFSPHFKSWGYQVPVVDMLRGMFPVGYALHVDNWVRYQAYAEMKIGLARQAKRFLEIATEPDGVTSGLVWDGSLVGGNSGLAGEIGHMPVDIGSDVLCACGGHGCLEPAISLLRMEQKAREKARDWPDSPLCPENDPRGITYERIFEAAGAADPFARKLLDEVAGFFAAAIVHVVQVCDPELIIIQGEYAKAGMYFLERVRDGVRKTTLPGLDKNVQIQYSRLGDAQGIIGAAHFAADQLFKTFGVDSANK